MQSTQTFHDLVRSLRLLLLHPGVIRVRPLTSRRNLALFLRLPDSTVDLTSWNHWRLPPVENGTMAKAEDLGPVLVTVEYEVAPDKTTEFLKAVRRYRRIRRRDGAQTLKHLISVE